MLVILLTESEAGTDDRYIKTFIHKFFFLSNKDKIVWIQLKGKDKYQTKHISEKISEKKKLFSSYGAPAIVLCLDVDNQSDPNVSNLNNSIEGFCKSKGWRLVWFNRDIEEVFLGRSVQSNKKVKESKAFERGQKVRSLDLNRFKQNDPRNRLKSSNLFLVLADHFTPCP